MNDMQKDRLVWLATTTLFFRFRQTDSFAAVPANVGVAHSFVEQSQTCCILRPGTAGPEDSLYKRPLTYADADRKYVCLRSATCLAPDPGESNDSTTSSQSEGEELLALAIIRLHSNLDKLPGLKSAAANQKTKTAKTSERCRA
jgi:hypothetical protein